MNGDSEGPNLKPFNWVVGRPGLIVKFMIVFQRGGLRLEIQRSRVPMKPTLIAGRRGKRSGFILRLMVPVITVTFLIRVSVVVQPGRPSWEKFWLIVFTAVFHGHNLIFMVFIFQRTWRLLKFTRVVRRFMKPVWAFWPWLLRFR